MWLKPKTIAIMKNNKKEEKETKKIEFGTTVFIGYDCVGVPYAKRFEFTMEFTADEIALMRQLVSQASEKKREKGCLAILQSGARKLANRMKKTLRQEAFEFCIHDAIRHGDIEFDEDELRANYNKDNGKDDSEDPEEDYYDWRFDEYARAQNESTEWIRSRYSAIDNYGVDDFLDLGYTVDIPKILLS